jgi:hypothetical protein
MWIGLPKDVGVRRVNAEVEPLTRLLGMAPMPNPEVDAGHLIVDANHVNAVSAAHALDDESAADSVFCLRRPNGS